AARELAELVVHVHAQGLERARRRMLAGLARAYRTRDERGELRGALERAHASCRTDRLGYAARKTLVGQCCDHFANLVDARPSEPGRDGLAAGRIHTHVERAVRTKAESACRVIELRGRDTEVEEHAAAETPLRMRRHETGKLRKRRVEERKPHVVGKARA